jgi:hypothetical protein
VKTEYGFVTTSFQIRAVRPGATTTVVARARLLPTAQLSQLSHWRIWVVMTAGTERDASNMFVEYHLCKFPCARALS